MKNVNFALLGFGIVGFGVYRVATDNKALIEHRDGVSLNVSRVLIRDFDHEPNVGSAPRELFTTNIDDIISDSSVSIVVECMGGVEPARSYILKALEAGKTVVTSNKEVISKHWPELEEAAQQNGVGLYIEGTVGGGIPLLRTITDSLQANEITSVMGIINGTTNYILSKMSDEGLEFDTVLKEAQTLGYAEADPTADVEGFDATYKLSILSSLSFHTHMPVNVIYREGITRLTAADFFAARQLGFEIKLLAIGKKAGKRVETRVHPTMIPKTHPLASVRGPFNAIFINGDAVGEVMLYGRGAGQMPTASAVIGDVVFAAHCEGAHRLPTFRNSPEMDVRTELVENYASKYFLRLRVLDQPGVLHAITGVFAKHNVSLNSVLQFAQATQIEGENIAWITFLTHTAQEFSMRAAITEMETLDCTKEVESIIRVEG